MYDKEQHALKREQLARHIDELYASVDRVVESVQNSVTILEKTEGIPRDI